MMSTPDSSSISDPLQDDDVLLSEEQMQLTAASLRAIYLQQKQSEIPQKDVLFHCAVGLCSSTSRDDIQFGIDILEELLEEGYLQNECRLYQAQAWYSLGYMVRARELLNTVLEYDPTNADAQSFDKALTSSVRKNGKITIYSLMILAAFGTLFWAYRRQKSQ